MEIQATIYADGDVKDVTRFVTEFMKKRGDVWQEANWSWTEKPLDQLGPRIICGAILNGDANELQKALRKAFSESLPKIRVLTN